MVAVAFRPGVVELCGPATVERIGEGLELEHSGSWTVELWVAGCTERVLEQSWAAELVGRTIAHLPRVKEHRH